MINWELFCRGDEWYQQHKKLVVESARYYMQHLSSKQQHYFIKEAYLGFFQPAKTCNSKHLFVVLHASQSSSSRYIVLASLLFLRCLQLVTFFSTSTGYHIKYVYARMYGCYQGFANSFTCSVPVHSRSWRVYLNGSIYCAAIACTGQKLFIFSTLLVSSTVFVC